MARIRAKVSQCRQSNLPVFFVIAVLQWRAFIMWENHDDNWGGKHAKSKDRDIDINIDVNADGERHFDNILRAGGSSVGGIAGLNLCDVAQGIRDVQQELRGGGSGGIFSGIRDGIHDGIRDGLRDRIAEGFHDGMRDAGGVIGKGDADGRGGSDFSPPKKRDEEPPYIDCEWGRLLEQNKTDMLHRAAKIGAVLKDAKG
jgi:hypothetical protein